MPSYREQKCPVLPIFSGNHGTLNSEGISGTLLSYKSGRYHEYHPVIHTVSNRAWYRMHQNGTRFWQVQDLYSIVIIGTGIQWRLTSSLQQPHESDVHGPLARYVKLRVAHAPGTFSPPPWVSDPDMHHGTCVTHVPWCMPGSLTSGFILSWWRGKRSRHSRRMRN